MDSNPQHNSLLDIKQMVQFGTRKPEDYSILFYKEVYGKEVKVKIRGLSNYEYDEISLEMYADIKDPATIKYVFNPTQPKIKAETEETEKDELDTDLPENINLIEYTRALTIRNALIVYYAMRDFYPDFTLNDVRQLEGIDEIAHRVNDKSGRTEEVMEKIKFFREQQRKLDTSVSSGEGTQTVQ